MFDAFILAGGQSSRMGREKALLEINKRSLVDIAAAKLLKAGAAEVTVLAGTKSKMLAKHNSDLNFEDDLSPELGAPGGIYSALQKSTTDATFILACDLPFVSEELIEFLLKKFSDDGADAVVPIQPDGFKQTLCGVYRKSTCLVPFQAHILRSELTPSVRDMLKKVNGHYIDFDDFSDLKGSEDFFINLNSPSDLEFARKTMLSR